MTANLKNLTKQLRCNLYVDFGDDLESAFNAMNVLATASKNPAAVYTAVYGIVNTLCNVIEEEVNAQNQAEQVQTDTHPCGADADQDQ